MTIRYSPFYYGIHGMDAIRWGRVKRISEIYLQYSNSML